MSPPDTGPRRPDEGLAAPVAERPSLWARAAVVTGLLALAVTQPLLDLMGQNPEFFVAGHYSSTQILAFGVIVAFLPALVAVGVLAVAARLNQNLGHVVFQLGLVGLGALLGNVVGRGLGLDGGKVALGASLVGGATAFGLARLRGGRLLLQYLAAANVLFLFSFLVLSPTSALLGSRSGELDLGRISMPTPPGPVVVIVFDELPISTLMRADGTINAERFPAFARLADTSTWYRNASSNHQRTERAVPEILVGGIPARDALPSYIDLPRNLITMLSSQLPVERYEAITDMCPPSMCTPRSSQSLTRALEDASVVYGHRVLPARLRERLPAIDQAWGGFGVATGGPVGGVPAGADSAEDPFASGRLGRWWEKSETERGPASQVAILEAQGEMIDATPALHFIHVVVPHAPWVITPWGTSLMGGAPERVEAPDDPAYEWSSRLQYQRHTLQVGAVDKSLGRVIDQLEAEGVWDDTTFVVAADHGTSLLPPDFGRDEITDDNRQEVFRIPLFIKHAGQEQGTVLDTPAQTIDLLPTLADLLDVETDWTFDGHSLLDGSRAASPPAVGESVEPLLDVVRRHVAQFPLGEDWTALAAVGEHAAMVGTKVSDHDVGPPSAMSWQPDHEEEFDSLPTPDGRAPQLLTGRVTTPDGARPADLVVAVNGTIAGSIGGFVAAGGSWEFGTVLGPFLEDGANEIVAYEVEGQRLRLLE